MYDVAVIGAGIVGASVTRELTRYNLNVCLIEKENDVSEGSTKANSAIIHAGYDPEHGTDMARHNVRGNYLAKKYSKELSVPYKQIGSLVVAFSEDEMETLEELLERGIKNEVPGIRIINREQLLEIEPQIGDEAIAALHAPSAGIIGPWEFTIALAENAVVNGAKLYLSSPVIDIEKEDRVFTITTSNPNVEPIKAKYIVNAAGLFADNIMAMAGEREFKITPRKGQYFVLDKSQGHLAKHVIFQCPTKVGKGVLITPTVHGNLLAGPDAEDIDDKYDKSTNKERLDFVREAGNKSIKGINYRENIRNFAGLRAYSDSGPMSI